MGTDIIDQTRWGHYKSVKIWEYFLFYSIIPQTKEFALLALGSFIPLSLLLPVFPPEPCGHLDLAFNRLVDCNWEHKLNLPEAGVDCKYGRETVGNSFNPSLAESTARLLPWWDEEKWDKLRELAPHKYIPLILPPKFQNIIFLVTIQEAHFLQQ